jgi:hypothetical protein
VRGRGAAEGGFVPGRGLFGGLRDAGYIFRGEMMMMMMMMMADGCAPTGRG